jgi:hypothetical protein
LRTGRTYSNSVARPRGLTTGPMLAGSAGGVSTGGEVAQVRRSAVGPVDVRREVGQQVEPGVDLGERGPRGVLTDPIPSAGQDLTLSVTPDTNPPAVHPPNPQRAQRIHASRPRQPAVPSCVINAEVGDARGVSRGS